MSENGISELQRAVLEAQGLAGVAASLDAEVAVAQERLIDLRAAAKTSAIEDQQDLMEEHAVASALQGWHMEPSAEENDSKPSADEDNARNECVVCLDAPKTIVLIPCGHKCLCEACAEWIEVGDPCPVCREKVAAKIALPANFTVFE